MDLAYFFSSAILVTVPELPCHEHSGIVPKRKHNTTNTKAITLSNIICINNRMNLMKRQEHIQLYVDRVIYKML